MTTQRLKQHTFTLSQRCRSASRMSRMGVKSECRAGRLPLEVPGQHPAPGLPGSQRPCAPLGSWPPAWKSIAPPSTPPVRSRTLTLCLPLISAFVLTLGPQTLLNHYPSPRPGFHHSPFRRVNNIVVGSHCRLGRGCLCGGCYSAFDAFHSEKRVVSRLCGVGGGDAKAALGL